MRERPPTITCEGCALPFNPFWRMVATVNGTDRTVCPQCTAILTRLGVRVSDPEP